MIGGTDSYNADSDTLNGNALICKSEREENSIR
jgi:hypothetical protein